MIKFLFLSITTFTISTTTHLIDRCTAAEDTTPDYGKLLVELERARSIATYHASKTLYREFLCAMQHFKSLNEQVCNRFLLNQLNIPHTNLTAWPQEMYKFMEQSDFYSNRKGKVCRLRVKIKEVGYSQWLELINCSVEKPCNTIVDPDYKLLQKKLTTYYEEHPNAFKNKPIKITDIDTLRQYFAATMQRTYRIGCMFSHELVAEFNNAAAHIKKDVFTEDFTDYFNKVFPMWNFTATEIDLINLAWGFLDIPETGKSLYPGYTFDNGMIIPVSTLCFQSYKFTTPTTSSVPNQ